MESNLKKNILVTGAAGFIGFHLSSALHARGDKVVGYDNFNDYYNPLLKRDRCKELVRQGIYVEEGDISDIESLARIVRENEITDIVHLAAQAGVRYSLNNPHAYIQANITGFLNVLEICKKNPRIKLTYASSSSVYGLNKKIPFSTEDRTDQQASLYGVTKKTNELMAQTYHHLFGISMTGLRFFTVYGPWGRPDMAYFSFTQAIVEGRPIEIYNQGNMLRDFTYIDDIISGTIAAIDLRSGCEVYNLGSHSPEKLLDFIHLIEQELGKEAKKIFLPMQAGDVVSTYADIETSAEILGFKPKTTLREGIKKFVDWYKNYSFR